MSSDSQALLAAMQPFFEQDGIALEYDAPHAAGWPGARCSATSPPPRSTAWSAAPSTTGCRAPRPARTVRRLQQEMQMLLYTHDVNEARIRGGLLPVNSFWVSGTGALPGSPRQPAAPGLQITHYLRDAALLEDWRGLGRRLAAARFERMRAAVRSARRGPRPCRLTLCGERNAQTWSSGDTGICRRAWASLFGRKSASALLRRRL